MRARQEAGDRHGRMKAFLDLRSTIFLSRFSNAAHLRSNTLGDARGVSPRGIAPNCAAAAHRHVAPMNGAGPSSIEIAATVIFAIAVLHTFTTHYFEHLAMLHPEHAGLWHLLGEVEVVFGFWAMVLLIVIALHLGTRDAVAYLESRSFTEPAFVFVIMVIAANRPISISPALRCASSHVPAAASRNGLLPHSAFGWPVARLAHH